MRILVLENELTSARGGQELSLLDVCRGLTGRGHRLTLAYVAPGDLEAEYRRFCERLVPVHGYSIDRTRTVAALFDFVRSIAAVRSVSPALVYANQYLDSLFAAALAKVFRVPFVCHLRLPPPDRWCTQFKVGMSHAAHLIATSHQTRQDWLTSGLVPPAISVVANGIDGGTFMRRDGRPAQRRRLGVPDDALLITYAGRLHPSKGIETLIDALALVATHRLPHLVIAGRPAVLHASDGTRRDYTGELKARALDRGVASAITWIDHHADMPGLFSAADVTVVPSLWSEPFGRVVIESMACETPVVASRVGGIPEILTGEFAAWLVEPGDPRALARQITDVANSSTQDPHVGTRARAHVLQHFSLERMVGGIERVLTAVVQSGNQTAFDAAVQRTS